MHISRAHIETGKHREHVHKKAHTHTQIRVEAPRYRKPQEMLTALWRKNERGASTRKASYVLAKVSQQDPYQRDGCAAHMSMFMYTSRYRTDVHSHKHMRDTFIHPGQAEKLLRVSSQTYNTRPLKGCLTLCGEIQKTAATKGDSDTHNCLYKTEPDLKQKCSEEEAG